MVFLHFPSNLTDEELMLQAKYSKLRKKKKALEQMKVPRIEVEKINPLKRPLDPKDAKELARKLIMSGKVALPTKQGDEKKTVFKRPRTLERKILATGRSEGHGGLTPGYNANYQTPDFQFEPFTPAPDSGGSPLSPVVLDRMNNTHHNIGSRLLTPSTSSGSSSSSNQTSSSNSSTTNSSGASSNNPSAPGSAPNSPTKRLRLMSSGNNTPNKSLKDMGDSYNNGDRNAKHLNKPKRGPTVYVQAHSISEDILRHQFGKYGKIINIKLNNPSVGFVTFDKVEGAELAVQEMNGSSIDDISYDVQFARRQPNISQLLNDASASASWTAFATSHSQKSNHQDRRQQVVYEDPMEC